MKSCAYGKHKWKWMVTTYKTGFLSKWGRFECTVCHDYGDDLKAKKSWQQYVEEDGRAWERFIKSEKQSTN